MIRLFLAIGMSAGCSVAMAQACSVSGTAYDYAGKPQRDAVVRLTNAQTQQIAFSATDANATFHFAGVAANADAQAYRVDLLSAPTVVTGSRIPKRSIVGMTPEFACRPGQAEHQDVRAGV
jgi:hypothetical protein